MPTTKRIGYVDYKLDNFHANVYLDLLRGDLKARGWEVAKCWAMDEAGGRKWAAEKKVPYVADVKEMAEKSFIDVYFDDLFGPEAQVIARARKPVIAAVSGYCLGGGVGWSADAAERHAMLLGQRHERDLELPALVRSQALEPDSSSPGGRRGFAMGVRVGGRLCVTGRSRWLGLQQCGRGRGLGSRNEGPEQLAQRAQRLVDR